MSGKKLWITLPNNETNMNLILKYNFRYGAVKEQPHEWFIKNFDVIMKLDGVKIFIQNAGDVIYVTDRYFHAVINLENVYGFAYTWYPKESPFENHHYAKIITERRIKRNNLS